MLLRWEELSSANGSRLLHSLPRTLARRNRIALHDSLARSQRAGGAALLCSAEPSNEGLHGNREAQQRRPITCTHSLYIADTSRPAAEGGSHGRGPHRAAGRVQRRVQHYGLVSNANWSHACSAQAPPAAGSSGRERHARWQLFRGLTRMLMASAMHSVQDAVHSGRIRSAAATAAAAAAAAAAACSLPRTACLIEQPPPSPFCPRDVSTGTALTSFKSNACPPNGLSLLGRDYLVAAQAARGGSLHFWAWHKDQPHQRCFAAEQLTAVAATRDGMFCAAGGSSGAIFVWETSSGRLLRTWPAHYKVRFCRVCSTGCWLCQVLPG